MVDFEQRCLSACESTSDCHGVVVYRRFPAGSALAKATTAATSCRFHGLPASAFVRPTALSTDAVSIFVKRNMAAAGAGLHPASGDGLAAPADDMQLNSSAVVVEASDDKEEVEGVPPRVHAMSMPETPLDGTITMSVGMLLFIVTAVATVAAAATAFVTRPMGTVAPPGEVTLRRGSVVAVMIDGDASKPAAPKP